MNRRLRNGIFVFVAAGLAGLMMSFVSPGRRAAVGAVFGLGGAVRNGMVSSLAKAWRFHAKSLRRP